MRAVFIGCACLLTTYVLADEEKMTSISHTCQGEQCVEQLCNSEKTYCIDSPYTLKDGNKIPVIRDVEQDQNFFLGLISNEETTNSLNQTVQQITLSDGSKWEVDQNFAPLAKSWKGGDHISINFPHPPGSLLYAKQVFNLQNESTHQGLPAKLVDPEESQSRKIAILDPANQKICLTNQICIKGPEKLSGIFATIKPGETAIIGLNTDLDSEEYPLLLIVSRSLGTLKNWIPLPVKLSG